MTSAETDCPIHGAKCPRGEPCALERSPTCCGEAIFAMIYKVLPNLHIAWGDVLLGAVATAVLFMVGKLLIELYLSYSSIASVYGAAGSLIILLMWVYYSTQILYVGAELTKVYAQRRGLMVTPHAAQDGA